VLASRLPVLIVILALLLLVDSTTLAYSIFEGAFPSVVERGLLQLIGTYTSTFPYL